jgi:hypothetical protein
MNPLAVVKSLPREDPGLKHHSVNLETARSAPIVARWGLPG